MNENEFCYEIWSFACCPCQRRILKGTNDYRDFLKYLTSLEHGEYIVKIHTKKVLKS